VTIEARDESEMKDIICTGCCLPLIKTNSSRFELDLNRHREK